MSDLPSCRLADRPATPTVTWIVKPSKFCNLRCTYCYEWDDLADRKRMSLDQWRWVFAAVGDYAAHQSERLQAPVQSRIVWHGGEPLLLPFGYMREVVAIEREMFDADALAAGAVRNVVQTNLTALPDAKLEFLHQSGFDLWFSFDWIAGTRLDRRGNETEAIVAGNLRRVLERGIDCFGVTVLARHTLEYLWDIYEQYETLGVGFRVLPMFEAPNVTPGSPLDVSDDEVVKALCELFVHWFERGRRIRVLPIEDYLHTALLRIAGLERPRHDRRQRGELVMLVNTDGTLYPPGERYATGGALGNLYTQTIGEIIASPSYATSLSRSDDLVARHCGPCRFLSSCDGYPVQAHPHRWPSGPCPIAARVCAFIEDYFSAEHGDDSMLAEIAPFRLPIQSGCVSAVEL